MTIIMVEHIMRVNGVVRPAGGHLLWGQIAALPWRWLKTPKWLRRIWGEK
ncbi:MAG: hypothetical protein U0401_11205 [Anaerolineae bacterium]